ncbi:TolC family protein [Haliangium ochraceum]|uniref:TolC family protein n=1 Tax=Haliangium ochraceum TaxID=80816 RepID=UPI00126A17DE|nr:TolC family protein [Haliangium ochraceum]
MHRNAFGCALLLGALLGAGQPLAAEPAGPQQADSPARSAAPLNEAEVIRLARERAPARAFASATEALAEARERNAGRLANPRLSWQREAFPGGAGSVQDVFEAGLTLDLAGRRTRRALAASESAWARAEGSLLRADAVLEALLAYYEVVAGERRVALREQAEASLEEAARVLARREEAGAASGYERARLVVAGELARSRAAEARGELAAARVRLGALLGVDAEGLRVAADDAALALAALPSAAELAESADARALSRNLRAAEERAAEAEEHAAWTWLPAFELSGGATIERAESTRYGYVVGVSLSVPLLFLDSARPLRAEAEAQRAVARARSEMLARTLRGQAGAAHAAYEAARAELARFEGATAEPVALLLRAAESGYREGERSIVELLDAQRARTEVEERRLALWIAAKRAQAHARAAGGVL